MDNAVLTLAFSAGALAALNPCGFALLPAYLSMFVLPEPGSPAAAGPSAMRSVARALKATALMTAGFVVVFGLFGVVISPAVSAAQGYLPYVTAATGVLLVVAGAVMLVGRRLSVPAPRLRGASGRGPGATFTYGVVYALASLTCTVGPFLAIVATRLRSDSFRDGLAVFGAYALGMGAVVGVAAVAVAVASGVALGRMRSTGRWVPRLIGALLVLVGAYVAWYGVWEIRVLHGADPDDPVVDTALQVQRWLNDRVRSVLPG